MKSYNVDIYIKFIHPHKNHTWLWSSHIFDKIHNRLFSQYISWSPYMSMLSVYFLKQLINWHGGHTSLRSSYISMKFVHINEVIDVYEVHKFLWSSIDSMKLIHFFEAYAISWNFMYFLCSSYQVNTCLWSSYMSRKSIHVYEVHTFPVKFTHFYEVNAFQWSLYIFFEVHTVAWSSYMWMTLMHSYALHTTLFNF